MDGKDLVRRIDLDPDVNGNNKTIVATLKTDSWELPLFFRLGVAMDLYKNDLVTVTAAADAIRPNDNSEHVNAGAQVSFKDIVFLRAGYKALFLSDSEEGFTAGVGVHYPLFGNTAVAIDYTYHEFGIFKNVQTVTLGVTF